MLRRGGSIALVAAVAAAMCTVSMGGVASAAASGGIDPMPAVTHPGPQVHKVVRGTYQRIAADVANATPPPGATIPPPLASTHDVYRDVLEVGDHWLDIHLPKGHHVRPGQQIELSGTGNADSFDATSVTVLPHAVASVDTTDVTKTLVILAYWGASHDTMTKAKAADVVFTQGNAWWKEASYGLTSLSGTVVDWVHISNPGDCYSNGDQLMNSARSAAANRIGSLASYERTIVYFPFCLAAAGAAGWAYVPGTRVWINGYMDKRTTIHEQGHNYGLLHAHFYSCTSGGVHVSLGGSCSSSEYGDNYDAMGGASYVGHFSAPQKAKLAWLPGKVYTYSSSGTATITPLETASGIKVGKILAGGSRTYWVEDRTAQGQDKSFPSGGLGVLVHLSDPGIADGGNQLLDMRPRAGSSDVVSLPLGSSWTTPERIRITYKSSNTSGAQVAVTYSAPPASVPNAPGGVSAKAGDTAALVSWGIPSDNGDALTGYKVYYQTGTTVKNVAVNSGGGSVHTVNLTGLTNSTAYSVWVRAVNGQGEGPASAKVSVTPLVQVPSVSLTAPAADSTQFSDEVTLTATPTVNATSKQAISNVQFFVDGDYYSQVSSAPYTVVWDGTYEKDGTHTVQAVTVDANNRVGRSAVITFTLHKPVPAVSITGTQLDSADPNLVHVAVNATAGSPTAVIDSVVLTYDDGQFAGQLFSPASADTVVDWDVRWVEGGDHTLVATATDSTGRSTASSPFPFTVTHPTPLVSITAPTDGTTVYGNFTVATTVQPGHNANGSPGADVSVVEIIADSTVSLGSADSTMGWSVDVLANQLTAGPHVLTARATDGDGYVGLSAPVTVTFEPPVPTVTVSSPAAGAQVFAHDSTGAIPIVTQPLPSVHGATPIYSVEVLVDDAEFALGAAYGPDDPNDPQSPWTVQLPLSTLTQGTHVLVVRVTDQAQYTGSTAPFTLEVLVPLPQVDLSAPTNGTFTGLFTASATAVPNPTSGAAIQEVDFTLDGAYVGSDGDGSDGWSADIDPNNFDNGEHTLVASALDAFGYRGQSSPAGISFQTPGPTASITSPVDNPTRLVQQALEPVSVSAQVGSTAPDPLSQVSLLVDGGQVDTVAAADLVNGTTANLSTGLIPAGTHTLRIEVVDDTGRTRHSSPLTLTVLTPPQAPYAYAFGGDGKITMTWYPPSDTGGLPVSSYTIVVTDPNNESTPLLTKTLTAADLDLSATEFSYDVLNQPPGVDRELTVTARTAQDVPASDPSFPSVAAAYDATAPDPVSGLAAVGSLSGVSLTWAGSPSPDVSAQDVYVDSGPDALLYGTPTTLDATARGTGLSGLDLASDQTASVVTRDASGNVGPPVSVTVHASTITLSRSAATVTYGGSSTLTATVRQATGSAALSGVSVQFLSRHKGSGSYSVFATRVTSGTGVGSVVVKPTRNMEYLARYLGGPSRFGRQTGAVAVLVRTVVKSSLSTTSIHLGQSVVVRGSVAPKHAGQKVLIQRLAGGTWKTIATVKLSSLSTFRFVWKPTKKATYPLRVVKPADSDHVISYGVKLKLRVL